VSFIDGYSKFTWIYFDRAIEQRDGSVISHLDSNIFLWHQSNVRTINALQTNITRVKGRAKRVKIFRNYGPTLLNKVSVETIRSK
jgi:hypothetical protein